MDSDPPPLEVFTATHVTTLLGGPFDGGQWNVPAGCIEFYGDPGPGGTHRHHYRYCPHASARFGKDCFIYSTLSHDLYAR